MTPAEYDAWYDTPRGRWIGEAEYRLIRRSLDPAPGESVLDSGCGTGYFTRRLATDGFDVTGIDSSPAMIRFARTHAAAGETYLLGDLRALPFPNRQFDHAIAITSLSFVEDSDRAVRELARAARRSVALGLLNRNSLLFLEKGRRGGNGGYQGARWDTPAEARALLARAGLRNITIRSAVFAPGGSLAAQLLDSIVPSRLAAGGFLLVTGERP